MKSLLTFILVLFAIQVLSAKKSTTSMHSMNKANTQAADSMSLEDVNKNININGVTLFALKKLVMGTHHPALWQSQHCRQIAYFPNQSSGTPSKKGWYFDMPSESCKPITVPAGAIATLNFWPHISGCTANCTQHGKGLVFQGVPKINVDPRKICILPTYSSKTGGSCTQHKRTLWTYDAKTMTCYEVQVPCQYKTTLDTFSFNSTCQHMCHDVTLPGSSSGHHL